MKPNDKLETPRWVWEPLGPFDLDPCAGATTRIGSVNITIESDPCGLQSIWFGYVFCNPPFSQKENWIQKMLLHRIGILLLPERGSAPWFGPLAKEASAHFVMGKKINFIGGTSSNNVGSVLFCFGDYAVNKVNESGLPGHMNYTRYFRPRQKNKPPTCSEGGCLFPLESPSSKG